MIKPFLKRPLDKWVITQVFGANPQIYKKFGLAGHDGIDLRVRFLDSPLGRRYVTAAADGVVERVAWDKTGYGTHVRIRHGNGCLTIYGHNTKLYVAKGQYVKQGQLIALTGNTGFSTGAHLHFELRIPGQEGNGFAGAVNPLDYLLN